MQASEDNITSHNALVNRIAQLRETVQHLLEQNENAAQDKAAQKALLEENETLKKQLNEKEKNIKELGFKLEMLRMAKNIQTEPENNLKNEKLKNLINEYIKELDKTITSLNMD